MKFHTFLISLIFISFTCCTQDSDCSVREGKPTGRYLEWMAFKKGERQVFSDNYGNEYFMECNFAGINFDTTDNISENYCEIWTNYTISQLYVVSFLSNFPSPKSENIDFRMTGHLQRISIEMDSSTYCYYDFRGNGNIDATYTLNVDSIGDFEIKNKVYKETYLFRPISIQKQIFDSIYINRNDGFIKLSGIDSTINYIRK